MNTLYPKLCLLATLFYLCPFMTNAQTWTTNNFGDWDDPAIWDYSPGVAPAPGYPDLKDGTNIGSGTTINIEDGTTGNPLNYPSDQGNFNIPNGVTVNITNSFVSQSDGNFEINNGGNLNISGAVLNLGSGNLVNEGTINIIMTSCFDITQGSLNNNTGGAVTGQGLVRISQGNLDSDGTWADPVEYCVPNGSVSNNLPETSTENCNFVNTGCDALIITLPIELTSFTGEFENQKTVNLKWETASEIDNEWFVIEKKYPHQLDFMPIGELRGAGTTDQTQSYSFKDTNADFDQILYRIKQIDFNGEFTHSEIISLQKNIESNQVYVFANNEEFVVTIETADQNFAKSLDVYNIYGNLVQQIDLPQDNQQQFYQHYLQAGSLSKGMFFVNVTFEDGSQKVVKFMK